MIPWQTIQHTGFNPLQSNTREFNLSPNPLHVGFIFLMLINEVLYLIFFKLWGKLRQVRTDRTSSFTNLCKFSFGFNVRCVKWRPWMEARARTFGCLKPLKIIYFLRWIVSSAMTSPSYNHLQLQLGLRCWGSIDSLEMRTNFPYCLLLIHADQSYMILIKPFPTGSKYIPKPEEYPSLDYYF